MENFEKAKSYSKASNFDQVDQEVDQEVDQLFEDNFEFKPLTKGLGFHHSIKNSHEIRTSLKQQQVELKENLDMRAQQLNKPIKKLDATNMGDLAPFYQEQKKQEIAIDINVNESQEHIVPLDKTMQEASMMSRFGAWILDVIIINALCSIAFISMMLTSSTPLSVVRELIMSIDLFITIIPIYTIFYIFYFSFFDKTSFSTPGKRLIGLKVVSFNGDEISMLQALMRSAITVVSLLTFGLITMIDAQSKLTDTQVINRK